MRMCNGIIVVLVYVQITKADFAVTIKHAFQPAPCPISVVVEYVLHRGAAGGIELGHTQAVERVLDSLEIITDATEAFHEYRNEAKQPR
jgi:hypothetical protein